MFFVVFQLNYHHCVEAAAELFFACSFPLPVPCKYHSSQLGEDRYHALDDVVSANEMQNALNSLLYQLHIVLD